jgi:transposase
MNREELEQLTKPELIDLLLGLQRPGKTSRTSSKPPSTDWKGKREGIDWRNSGDSILN